MISLFGESHSRMCCKPSTLQTKKLYIHKSLCVCGMYNIYIYYYIITSTYLNKDVLFFEHICVCVGNTNFIYIYTNKYAHTDAVSLCSSTPILQFYFHIYEQSTMKTNLCLLMFEPIFTLQNDHCGAKHNMLSCC